MSKLIALSFLVVVLIFAVNIDKSSAKDIENITYKDIESITYTIIPNWPFPPGKKTTIKSTVYSSGDVLQQEINDFGELVSDTKFNVGKDRAAKLFESFYENNFFTWPDDLSIASRDGNHKFFEVATQKNHFKKGGLNPYYKNFDNCELAFLKCIKKGKS